MNHRRILASGYFVICQFVERGLKPAFPKLTYYRILVLVRTGTSGSWHIPVKSQCYLRFSAKIPAAWYWFGMPVLIHFRDMNPKNLFAIGVTLVTGSMKAAATVFVASLILMTPMVLHAQRFGFSIGAPTSQSTGAITGGARTASAPQMPPLPRPLPTLSVIPLPSLQMTLKPLDLLSNHLAPPLINFAPDLRRPALPALPFALDPIAARSLPQMCVDPR
jgi:hypothetical protein